MDLTRIKYYPDKFYIRLDGFDLSHLNTFLNDETFSEQQAIYLHEYYHYLTNITTFYGARQFNCQFQDRVRLITILLKKKMLDAFPISQNQDLSCKYEVSYWNSITEIVNLDDLDERFANIVESSSGKRFSITKITPQLWPLSVYCNGHNIQGAHTYYKVDVDGGTFQSSFNLSDGMIDEFLSSSIDEFMFHNNLANNCDVLRAQTFYPYRTFDVLLDYYGLHVLNAQHKIAVAYFALHSFNPIVALIEVLENMRNDGGAAFIADPIGYLRGQFKGNEMSIFDQHLRYEKAYIKECVSHHRYNLADTMQLIYEKQYNALTVLKQDFFHFIRPFFVKDLDTSAGRKQMLGLFKDIRTLMSEPIIVKDRQMIAADTDCFKNHLAMQIAIYEIMDSLWVNRIAKRLPSRKQRYAYPKESADNDMLVNLPETLPLEETWHVALNELSLYGVYLNEKKQLHQC